MSARPRKHSVTLRGHRTSISLEDEFWEEFRAIAAARGINKDFQALADFRLPVIIRQAGRANGPVLYFLIFTGPGRDQPVGFDHGITHSVGINIVPHVCPLFQRSPNCTKGLAGVTLRSLQVRDRF